MSQEVQSKKTSQIVTDAAVKEIPTKPTGELSNMDLDKVAGGLNALNAIARDTSTTKQEKETIVNTILSDPNLTGASRR